MDYCDLTHCRRAKIRLNVYFSGFVCLLRCFQRSFCQRKLGSPWYLGSLVYFIYIFVCLLNCFSPEKVCKPSGEPGGRASRVFVCLAIKIVFLHFCLPCLHALAKGLG